MTQSVGRISIDVAKPGIYMMNNNSEVYESTTAFYLRNHLDLRWFEYTGTAAFERISTIKFMAGDYPIGIGRKVIGGITYLGRVI